MGECAGKAVASGLILKSQEIGKTGAANMSKAVYKSSDITLYDFDVRDAVQIPPRQFTLALSSSPSEFKVLLTKYDERVTIAIGGEFYKTVSFWCTYELLYGTMPTIRLWGRMLDGRNDSCDISALLMLCIFDK